MAVPFASGGCAAAAGAPPEYPALPEQSSRTSTPLASPAPPPASVAALDGDWVEFWALAGAADTQRYTFAADGHFEWSAAGDGAEEVAVKAGTYALRGSTLELTVRAEQPRDASCDAGCKRAVDPPRVEQYALADCPPDEEARALDASYRCISVDERAFWRRSAEAERAAAAP